MLTTFYLLFSQYCNMFTFYADKPCMAVLRANACTCASMMNKPFRCVKIHNSIQSYNPIHGKWTSSYKYVYTHP